MGTLTGAQCGECFFGLVAKFEATIDGPTVLSLRQVVHDIPNVGGINDPYTPRLADVRRRQMRVMRPLRYRPVEQ